MMIVTRGGKRIDRTVLNNIKAVNNMNTIDIDIDGQFHCNECGDEYFNLIKIEIKKHDGILTFDVECNKCQNVETMCVEEHKGKIFISDYNYLLENLK